jgi:hypothetical protein
MYLIFVIRAQAREGRRPARTLWWDTEENVAVLTGLLRMGLAYRSVYTFGHELTSLTRSSCSSRSMAAASFTDRLFPRGVVAAIALPNARFFTYPPIR